MKKILLIVASTFLLFACPNGDDIKPTVNISYFSQGKEVKVVQVEKGEKIAFQGAPDQSGNFYFDGWYKDKDCTDENIWLFDKAKAEENLSLYAKWIPFYILTIHLNGAEQNPGEPLVQTVVEGFECIDISPSPQLRAYSFEGFCKNEDLSDTPVEYLSDIELHSDLDVYAKFEKKGYVKFVYYSENVEIDSSFKRIPNKGYLEDNTDSEIKLEIGGVEKTYKIEGYFTNSELTASFDFTTQVVYPDDYTFVEKTSYGSTYKVYFFLWETVVYLKCSQI